MALTPEERKIINAENKAKRDALALAKKIKEGKQTPKLEIAVSQAKYQEALQKIMLIG